jgi:hypothetical protein
MNLAKRVASRFYNAASGFSFDEAGVTNLARALATKVQGHFVQTIGKFRWSENNVSALIRIEPDVAPAFYVVVSLFEDGDTAIKFFQSKHLSETETFENITSFTYHGVNLHETAEDIRWASGKIDEMYESWQPEDAE